MGGVVLTALAQGWTWHIGLMECGTSSMSRFATRALLSTGQLQRARTVPRRRRRSAISASGILRLPTKGCRPFAIESFGRFGEEALAVLGEARHRVAERSGRRAAGSVASRWFGLLQCQLVLAQHEAAMAMEGARVAPLAVVALPFGRR